MKGMTQSLTRRWATKTVLRHLDPKLVVVNVQPTLLVTPAGAQVAESQRVVSSYNYYLRQVEDEPLNRLDRTLSGVSDLIKYRADLQNPANVWDAIKGTVTDAPVPKVPRDDTLAYARETIEAGGRNAQYRDAPEAVLPDRSMAQAFQKAFSTRIDLRDTESLLRALQAKGYEVVVVVMPIDKRTLVPLGLDPNRFDPARRDLAALDRRLRIPTLDYTDLDLPPLDFHDKVHLAQAGAEVFSRQVAADVDRLCQDGRLRACRPT